MKKNKKIMILINILVLITGVLIIFSLITHKERVREEFTTTTTNYTTTAQTTLTTSKTTSTTTKKAKSKKKKYNINVKGYNIKYNKSEIIEYLHVMVLAYGWDEEEYKSAYKLMNNESGFNPNNINRATKGGACGLAQAHPCSKVPYQYEIDWKYQVRWFLDYIKNKYKKPSIAYNKWLKNKPHSY